MFRVNCTILRSSKVLSLLLQAVIYGLFSEKDLKETLHLVFSLLENAGFLEESLEILLDFTSICFFFERKDASLLRKHAIFPYKLRETQLLLSQEFFCDLFEKLIKISDIHAKILNPSVFIGFLKQKAENCVQNVEKFADLCGKPRFLATCRGFLQCFLQSFARSPAGFLEDDDFETYLSVLSPYINEISATCSVFFEGNSGFLRKKLLFLVNCMAISCENFEKILETVANNEIFEEVKEVSCEKAEKAEKAEKKEENQEICLNLFEIFLQNKEKSPLKSLLRTGSNDKFSKKTRIFEGFFAEIGETQENPAEILSKLYKKEIFVFFLPKQRFLEKALSNLLLSFKEVSLENAGELESFLEVFLKILNNQQNIADLVRSEKLENCAISLDFRSFHSNIFEILWKLFVSKGLCVNKLENYLEIIAKSLDNECNYLSILLKVLEAFAEANLNEERENAVFLLNFIVNFL